MIIQGVGHLIVGKISFSNSQEYVFMMMGKYGKKYKFNLQELLDNMKFLDN